MRTALAIAAKDWRVLWRQKSALFFVIGWPLIVALFFGMVFGGGGGTAKPKIAVVDRAQGREAATLIEVLRGLTEIDIDVQAEAAAEALVRRGQRAAAIVIPVDYEQRAARLFRPDGPSVELWVDPSRKAEAAMLQGLLMKAGAQLMQARISDPTARKDWLAQARSETAGLSAGSATTARAFFDALDTFMDDPAVALNSAAGATGGVDMSPLKVSTRDLTRERRAPANAFAVSFTQGMFWAAFGCLMTFATGLVTERTQGTWSRLRVAPVGTGELLFGKALGCFSAMLLVMGGLLMIGRIGFGVPFAGLTQVVLAVAAAAACFTGLMMLLSTLGRNDRAVSGLSFAVLMPMAMLGGAMVPSFAMPAFMQSASAISPVKWAVLGLEGATWRGFDLLEMAPALLIQLVIGSVAFGLGIVVLRRGERRAA